MVKSRQVPLRVVKYTEAGFWLVMVACSFAGLTSTAQWPMLPIGVLYVLGIWWERKTPTR